MKRSILKTLANVLHRAADAIAAQPPARIAVESDMMKSVGWHKGTLEIEFKSESVYTYAEVPRQLYERLMAAESKGKFFNAYIRDIFVTEKRS